jgi:serine/threonine protein kinase
MKRYDGCVEVNDFCKTHWRTLAIHVLQFLQDFHHAHGLLHMDIKKPNILVDTDKIEFIVADYEHAEPPSSLRTTDYDENHLWYYLAMGAEIDEQLYSWRFDLVALGYLLASLTVEPKAWTFERKCWNRRDGKNAMPHEELVALRAQELRGANPIVCTYMDRLATVSWTAKEPPPRQFYKDLETLFK